MARVPHGTIPADATDSGVNVPKKVTKKNPKKNKRENCNFIKRVRVKINSVVCIFLLIQFSLRRFGFPKRAWFFVLIRTKRARKNTSERVRWTNERAPKGKLDWKCVHGVLILTFNEKSSHQANFHTPSNCTFSIANQPLFVKSAYNQHHEVTHGMSEK